MGNSHSGNKSQTSVRSVTKSKSLEKSSQKISNSKLLKFVKCNKVVVSIVLAVATISLILFITFGTGLSKKKADEMVQTDWETIVSSYGSNTSNSWRDELPEYIETEPTEEDNESEDKPEFVTMIEKRVLFTPIDIKKSEGTYILTYSVTAPDLKSHLNSYLEEHGKDAIDLAGMNQLLIELVEKSELKETKAEVAIYKENGEYKVSYSYEFFDAMYGGIYSFSLEAIANKNNQTEESKKETD